MILPISEWESINLKSSQKSKEENRIISLKFNSNASHFCVLSSSSISIWLSEPKILLVELIQNKNFKKSYGPHKDILWRFNHNWLAISTFGGWIFLYEIRKRLDLKMFEFSEDNSSGHDGVQFVFIKKFMPSSLVECMTSSHNYLFIGTRFGTVECIRWGESNGSLCTEYQSRLMECFIERAPEFSEQPVVPVKIQTTSWKGYLAMLTNTGFWCVFNANKAFNFLSKSENAMQENCFTPKEKILASIIQVNRRFLFVTILSNCGEIISFKLSENQKYLEYSHSYLIDPSSKSTVFQMSFIQDDRYFIVLFKDCSIRLWSTFGMFIANIPFRSYNHPQNLLSSLLMSYNFVNMELILVQSSHVNLNAESSSNIPVEDVTESCQSLRFGHVISNKFTDSNEYYLIGSHDRIFVSEYPFCYQNQRKEINPYNSSFLGCMHHVFFPQGRSSKGFYYKHFSVNCEKKFIAAAGMNGFMVYLWDSQKWLIPHTFKEASNIHVTCNMVWKDEFLFIPCKNSQTNQYQLLCFNVMKKIQLSSELPLQNEPLVVTIHKNYLAILESSLNLIFAKFNISEPSSMRILFRKCLQQVIPHSVLVTDLKLIHHHQSSYEEQTDNIVLDANKNEYFVVFITVGGNLYSFFAEDSSEELTVVDPKSFYLIDRNVENSWLGSDLFKQNLMSPLSKSSVLNSCLWTFSGNEGLNMFVNRQILNSHDQKVSTIMECQESLRNFDISFSKFSVNSSMKFVPLVIDLAEFSIRGLQFFSINSGCTSSGSKINELFSQKMSTCRMISTMLPNVLAQMIDQNLDQTARNFAECCQSSETFSTALELLLYAAINRKFSEKNEFADLHFRKVVALVKSFPSCFERVVVNCCRKLECSMWKDFFSVVGEPKIFYLECLSAKKYEIASTYLMIMLNIESPSEFSEFSLLFLDNIISNKIWVMVKDLVRFLRSIVTKPSITSNCDPVSSPTLDITLDTIENVLKEYLCSYLLNYDLKSLGEIVWAFDTPLHSVLLSIKDRKAYKINQWDRAFECLSFQFPSTAKKNTMANSGNRMHIRTGGDMQKIIFSVENARLRYLKNEFALSFWRDWEMLLCIFLGDEMQLNLSSSSNIDSPNNSLSSESELVDYDIEYLVDSLVKMIKSSKFEIGSPSWNNIFKIQAVLLKNRSSQVAS